MEDRYLKWKGEIPMITDCYDIQTKPALTLQDFYGDKRELIEHCLVIFSPEIRDHLLSNFPCEKIGEMRACTGNIPIYKLNYKGRDIAFYLTHIGSALASSLCIEANWNVGATKFIMCGSCGCFDNEKTKGKFIIPTESYRGEGASYYYAPPADYITVKNSQKVAEIFQELGVPYVLGRVWTTDSVVRETVGLVAKRKTEGCLAVEMEIAGVQSACDFYGFELYDFLEGGDVLGEDCYDITELHQANHDHAKTYLAMEIALRV